MVTQSEIPPSDKIEPQSPDEAPSTPEPEQYPVNDPPENEPIGPDRDEPSPGMPEILPPPD